LVDCIDECIEPLTSRLKDQDQNFDFQSA